MDATAGDRDLVRRMRAGEEAAFREFADHCIPAVHRFAMARLGRDRELARDIVSSAICKAIEKLDGYRGEAPLFTWLCAVCRNEIAAHFRRQHGGTVVAIDAAREEPEAEEDPEAVLLEKESSALVHRALDHLPPRYASALQWKYIDGLPVDEIAHRLQLGLKAAESVLTRARQAFRGAYEQLAGKR